MSEPRRAVAMMAPIRPPKARRAISGKRSMRGGVLGSLSPMYSPAAKRVKTATEMGLAVQKAQVPATGSSPSQLNQQRTAMGRHGTHAGCDAKHGGWRAARTARKKPWRTSAQRIRREASRRAETGRQARGPRPGCGQAERGRSGDRGRRQSRWRPGAFRPHACRGS